MNIERLVALTRRQDLEPVEGRGAPVHPPTCLAPRNARASAPGTRSTSSGTGPAPASSTRSPLRPTG